MGTSDLLPIQTEIVGTLGTYYLQLASELGGGEDCLVGLSPKFQNLTLCVRIELNHQTSSWSYSWLQNC